VDTRVMIFGDFHVKHGSHQMIADKSLEEQAEDVQTAQADGIIVTGLKTGNAPTREDVEWIKQVVQIPVLIGSGLTVDNVEALYPLVDGGIVGSHFKIDENLKNPVDVGRVTRFMEKVKTIRSG
jgi:predicted TIM-barrel enzyme